MDSRKDLFIVKTRPAQDELVNELEELRLQKENLAVKLVETNAQLTEITTPVNELDLLRYHSQQLARRLETAGSHLQSVRRASINFFAQNFSPTAGVVDTSNLRESEQNALRFQIETLSERLDRASEVNDSISDTRAPTGFSELQTAKTAPALEYEMKRLLNEVTVLKSRLNELETKAMVKGPMKHQGFLKRVTSLRNEVANIEATPAPTNQEAHETEKPQQDGCWQRFRTWDQHLVQHRYYTLVIMLAIIVNSVFLAMDDPTSDETADWETKVDYVFTVIFGLECVTKLIALDIKYFKDGWNILDFIVVVESLYSSVPGLDIGVDLSWLRVMRVLRPLKTVKQFPAMQKVVSATMKSLVPVSKIFAVFLFFIVVCSMVCVQLFNGLFLYRCQDDETGEIDGDTLCYEASGSSDGFCSALEILDNPYTCDEGQTCVYYGENPNRGGTSFDHMGWAILANFQVSSMEGWHQIMWWTQATMSEFTFIIISFVLIFGAFVLVNMIIAAILMEFQAAAEDMDEKEEGEGGSEEGNAELESKTLVDVAVNYEEGIGTLHRRRSISLVHKIDSFVRDMEKPREEREREARREARRLHRQKKRERRRARRARRRARRERRRQREIESSMTALDITIVKPDGATGLELGWKTEVDQLNGEPLQVLDIHEHASEDVVGKFKIGDMIISVNGSPITSIRDVMRLSQSIPAGALLEFQIHRWGALPNNTSAITPRRDTFEIDKYLAGEPEEEFKQMEQERHGVLHESQTLPQQDEALAVWLEKYHVHDPEMELEDGEVPIQTRGDFKWHLKYGIGNKALRIQCTNEDSILARFIMVCIIVGTIGMAADGHLIPGWLETTLYQLNFWLTIVFIAEMGIKLIVIGPVGYCSDNGNIFDGCIVVGTLVELIMESVGGLNGMRMIRLLRLVRIARIGKLARQWPSLFRVVTVISRSASGIGPVLLLLLLFMFILSILGMQLFGSSLTGSGEEEDEIRFRFDNFYYALFSVFYVISGENWPDLMFLAVDKTHPALSLYFIFIILFGNYLLLNLVLAVVLDGCSDALDAKVEVAFFSAQINGILRRLWLRYSFRKMREFAHMQPHLTEDQKNKSGSYYVRKLSREMYSNKLDLVYGASVNAPRYYDLPFILLEDGQGGFTELKPVEEAEENGPDKQLTRKNNVRLLKQKLKSKSTREIMKDALYFLNNHRSVDKFIVFIISLSIGLMFYDEDPQWKVWLEFAIAWIFLLEIVWKSLHIGFVGKKGAYLSSRWHQLDFLIVICSFGSMLASYLGSAVAVSIFTLGRSFRPMRLVGRITQARVLLLTLGQSLASLGTLCVLLLFAWLVFAIIGMNLFKGTFYSCSDPDFPEGAYRYGTYDDDGNMIYPPCSGTYINATTGVEVTRDFEWGNALYTFDNMYSAMITVYILTTLTGWMTPLFSAYDAVDIDYQPKTFNSAWAFAFFFIGLFMFGLYLANLFIGIVFESFIEMKSTSVTGTPLTVEQRRWKDYEKRLKNVKPILRPLAPENKLRKILFNIAISTLFDNMIISVLVVNGAFLATTHYNQSSTLTNNQELSNVVFSFIFLVEGLIKLSGLGPKVYFNDGKNNFDFFITAFSMFDTCIYLAGMCTSSRAALLQLIRSLRVFRTVRLVNYIPDIDTIYTCIFYPLPLLCNVFLLLVVIIFIYGNMGVQFFHGVEFEEGSLYSNFDSLIAAMQLLFVMTTGGWSDIMEEVYDNLGTEPFLLLLYFGTFVVVVGFLLVNMFVMFIVETFELLSDENRREFDNLIPAFQECWSKYDPSATGHIDKKHLLPFLLDLPSPLGIAKDAPYLRLVFIIDAIETQPDYCYAFQETLVNTCTIAYREIQTHIEVPTLDDLFKKVYSVICIQRTLKKWIHHRREKIGLPSEIKKDVIMKNGL